MGSSKKTSAEWIIDQLNVENAKLVAFVLVIGFIGYHGILHLRYGNYKIQILHIMNNIPS